jgi:hypothetical protein
MTQELTVALIAAAGPVAAVLLAAYQGRQASKKINVKLDEIHVLVNSRLSRALEEILFLKKALVKEKADGIEAGRPDEEASRAGDDPIRFAE